MDAESEFTYLSPVSNANTTCFKARLRLAVDDIYQLRTSRPWALNRAQKKHLDAYTAEELTADLLLSIPTEVQNLLGAEETISLEDACSLEHIEACQPDSAPGVYLGMGIADECLPCLYVGMSHGEEGSKFRIGQHRKPSYRATQKGKLFYIHVDYPDSPRELHFIMLAKVQRNSEGLRTHGVARMLLMEQIMINMLDTMDPPARSRILRDLPSRGCVPLPPFLATNRDDPVIGSEDKPNDVLSAEEIAQKRKEARERPEYVAKQKVLNHDNYVTNKEKRDSGDPEAVKKWEKKRAQNHASEARRKVALKEGLQRNDREAIKQDQARKEVYRKANAKRRGKVYVPKVQTADEEPALKRTKL